jgi:hypothetical protein
LVSISGWGERTSALLFAFRDHAKSPAFLAGLFAVR